MRRISRPGALALLAFLAASPMAHAQTPCGIPAEYTDATTSLPQVAAALQPGGALSILAVGSATVLGPDKAPAGTGFPNRAADALRTARPGVDVQVEVEGSRGLSAAEQLERIRAAMARKPFQLVLWQTGTVEAVRNASPTDFAATLAEGTEAITAAGADVVLVDMQFSRFLRANANVDAYEEALQQAGSQPGVVLFHRYDLMRDWAGEGRIDLERASRSNRIAMAEQLHACLGIAIARLVLDGAGKQ